MRTPASGSEASRRRRRAVAAIIAIAVAATAVAASGVALVLTAPLDDDARSNLGVGLLTGLVVGVSIFALEFVVERRREAEQQRNRDAERDYLLDYAGRSLARLVVESARMLWTPLSQGDPQAIDNEVLPGYDRTADRIKVTTGVHWVADLDETGGDWFGDPSTVERADVLVQAGIHHAALEGSELGESDVDRLWFLVKETAFRVAGTSTYLSRHRESRTGQRVADVASNLRGGLHTHRIRDFTRVDLPRVRPLWSSDGEVEILHVGPEMPPGLAFLSELVGYTIDVLRRGVLDPRYVGDARRAIQGVTGELRVGADLVAAQLTESEIVRNRWPSLVGADAGADPWRNRFAEDSWFRAVLIQAAASVSANYGVSHAR